MAPINLFPACRPALEKGVTMHVQSIAFPLVIFVASLMTVPSARGAVSKRFDLYVYEGSSEIPDSTWVMIT